MVSIELNPTTTNNVNDKPKTDKNNTAPINGSFGFAEISKYRLGNSIQVFPTAISILLHLWQLQQHCHFKASWSRIFTYPGWQFSLHNARKWLSDPFSVKRVRSNAKNASSTDESYFWYLSVIFTIQCPIFTLLYFPFPFASRWMSYWHLRSVCAPKSKHCFYLGHF